MTVRIWDARIVETSARLKMDLYKATQTAMESFLAGSHDSASLTLRQIATSGRPSQFSYLAYSLPRAVSRPWTTSNIQ